MDMLRCVSPRSGWPLSMCLSSSCSMAAYLSSRRNGFDKPVVKTNNPGDAAPCRSIYASSCSLCLSKMTIARGWAAQYAWCMHFIVAAFVRNNFPMRSLLFSIAVSSSSCVSTTSTKLPNNCAYSSGFTLEKANVKMKISYAVFSRKNKVFSAT